MEERYNKDMVNFLLECIKNNADDKDSVTKLYKMMYKPTHHIALNYLKTLRPSWRQNYADAEDIAGDTFVAILKKIDKFNFTKNGAAWIFRIAERLAKKFVAKRKREIGLDFEISDNKAELNLENKVIIADIFSKLNQHELRIVLMHYYLGYKYSKISAILKKSESSIKQTMTNIKKRNNISDGLLLKDK